MGMKKKKGIKFCDYIHHRRKKNEGYTSPVEDDQGREEGEIQFNVFPPREAERRGKKGESAADIVGGRQRKKISKESSVGGER